MCHMTLSESESNDSDCALRFQIDTMNNLLQSVRDLSIRSQVPRLVSILPVPVPVPVSALVTNHHSTLSHSHSLSRSLSLSSNINTGLILIRPRHRQAFHLNQ